MGNTNGHNSNDCQDYELHDIRFLLENNSTIRIANRFYVLMALRFSINKDEVFQRIIEFKNEGSSNEHIKVEMIKLNIDGMELIDLINFETEECSLWNFFPNINSNNSLIIKNTVIIIIFYI